jgi:hypothetical protein
MYIAGARQALRLLVNNHPGGNPGANLKSISHICYLREVAFEWEGTEETIYCPWVASRVDSFRAGHGLTAFSQLDVLGLLYKPVNTSSSKREHSSPKSARL